MKKLLASLILLAALAIATNGQTTAVTATAVADPNGGLYANGTWSVSFVPSLLHPNAIYLLNGSPFTMQFSGSIDNSGTFAVTVADNSIILPSGSLWQFQLCSFGGTCFQTQLFITGSTMEIGPALHNNSIPMLGGIRVTSPGFAVTTIPILLTIAQGQTAPAFEITDAQGHPLFTVSANGTVTCIFGCGGGSGNVTTGGTLTASHILLGNGGTDIRALGSLGTTTTVLHGNAAGDPSFGFVNLATDVTGILNQSNGGTGGNFAIQGTDPKLLSAGTFSGSTGVLICTDAQHGATTSGCPTPTGGTVVSVTGNPPISTAGTTAIIVSCITCTTSAASLALNQLVIGQGGQAEATLGSLGTNTTLLHGNAAGAPGFRGVDLINDPLANQGTTTTVYHGNAAGQPSFGPVNLASDVTGNLATSHLNNGTNATNMTFWRGDGSWASQLPAITSVTKKQLAGNVSLSPNTLTTVDSQAVTMPSAGCPCRVDVKYSYFWETISGSGSDTIVVYITDGVQAYAPSQQSASNASTPGGNSATEISMTYTNSQVVTFTVKAQAAQTQQIDALDVNTNVLHSYLQLVTQTSN